MPEGASYRFEPLERRGLFLGLGAGQLAGPLQSVPKGSDLPAPTLAPERSFTAGAPRTVLLTLSATFGGGS